MRLLTSLLFLAYSASASLATDKINLSQLSEMALKDHPRIAAMKADWEAAEARRAMALAAFRPQLSLNGYAASGNGSMIFPNGVEPFNYSLLPREGAATANATFMWKLYSFGRDKALGDAGAAEVRSQNAAVNVESLDVLASLRMAFAEALLKQDAFAAQQASVDSAREVEKTTQLRFEAGKVPEAFVLRAKAETAKAERDLAMAKAEMVGARSNVWEAAGLGQDSDHELGDWDIPLNAPATEKEAIATALQKRPELAAFQEQLNAAQARGSAADRAKLPELNLMAMNDFMGSSGMRGENGFKAGLILSFPLGDGGERSAEVKEAKAMAKRLESEIRGLRNRVSAEVATAWAEAQAAEPVRAAAQAELNASEEAYRIALIRYQEGKSILAELTDSRSQLTQARLAVAAASAYQRKAWAKLARATGSNR